MVLENEKYNKILKKKFEIKIDKNNINILYTFRKLYNNEDIKKYNKFELDIWIIILVIITIK